MFRIRLPTGEEAVFRAADELVQGVRAGLIGPGATILHQASGRWLPIESHPHYQKARAAAAASPRRRPTARPKPQLELGVQPSARTEAARPVRPPAPTPARAAPAPREATPRVAVQAKLRLVRPRQPAPTPNPRPLATPPPRLAPTDRPGPRPSPPRAAPTSAVGRPGRARPAQRPAAVSSADAAPPQSSHTTAADARRRTRPASSRPIATPNAGGEPKATRGVQELGLERVEASARRADAPRPRRTEAGPEAAGETRSTSNPPIPEGPVRRPMLTEAEATGLEFVESLKLAARTPIGGQRPPRRVTRPVSHFGHRPVWIGVAAMLFLALGRWITVVAFEPTTRMEAGMVPPLTPVTPEEAANAVPERRPRTASASDEVAAPEPAEPTTYEDAYAAAQGDVLRGLRSIRLEALFSPGRLTDADSLRATRRDLAAARNVVAVYRSQEVRIDAIYDHPRPTQRESYAVVQTVDSMFTMLDSVYAVLIEEEDAYRMSGGTMAFDRAAAARRYSRYRSWLRGRLGRWADRPSDTVPFTIGLVLRATAGGSLPSSGR